MLHVWCALQWTCVQSWASVYARGTALSRMCMQCLCVLYICTCISWMCRAPVMLIAVLHFQVVNSHPFWWQCAACVSPIMGGNSSSVSYACCMSVIKPLPSYRSCASPFSPCFLFRSVGPGVCSGRHSFPPSSSSSCHCPSAPSLSS